MDASSAETHPEIAAALRAAGCVFAEEEAALLEGQAHTPEDLERLVARRVGGEPLEQVLGWAEFCGLRIKVAPGVFVPRRRTAMLVDEASRLAAQVHLPVVVDLCCGTGAIGVAIAQRVAAVELHAADVDPDAVACARRNVTQGHVHEGDLYDALPSALRRRIDVLVVNAPYVPTSEITLMPREARLHEHHVALDGGPDGLDLHRRVAAAAGQWLAPGGSLLIETSSRQAAETASCCVLAGFDVQISGDGPARMVRAISAASASSGTITG